MNAPVALVSFMVRKVSPFLTVEVQGGTWSVKDLPGVLVGDRVLCLPTPDGRHMYVRPDTWAPAPGLWSVPVAHDHFGFPEGALVIGQALAGARPSAVGSAHASGPGAVPAPAMCGVQPQVEACPCGRARPRASAE